MDPDEIHRIFDKPMLKFAKFDGDLFSIILFNVNQVLASL